MSTQNQKLFREVFTSLKEQLLEGGADHILILTPGRVDISETLKKQYVGIVPAKNHTYYTYDGLGIEERKLIQRQVSYQVIRLVKTTSIRQTLVKEPLTEDVYLESIIRIGPDNLHLMLPGVHSESRMKYINDFTYGSLQDMLSKSNSEDLEFWISKFSTAAGWKEETLTEFNQFKELAETMLV